jgi:CHAT domain-containing protein/tetratricopeptide (TPR) repeat protein
MLPNLPSGRFLSTYVEQTVTETRRGPRIVAAVITTIVVAIGSVFASGPSPSEPAGEEGPAKIQSTPLEEAADLTRRAAKLVAGKFFDQAIAEEKRALALLREALPATDPRIAARLKALTLIHCEVGEFDQAIPPLEAAIKILRANRPADSSELADCLVRRGKLCARNAFKECQDLYSEAAELLRRVNPPRPRQLVDCLCELADVQLNLEDFSGTTRTVDELLPLLADGDPSRHAQWLCRRAQLYLQNKEKSEERSAARALLEKARGLWPNDGIDAPVEHAGGLAMLSWIYRINGDKERSSAVLAEAIEFDERTKTRVKQLVAEAKYDPAYQLYRDRVELAYILYESDKHEVAGRMIELGEWQEFMGFYPNAEKTLDEALKLLRQSDPKGCRQAAAALVLRALVCDDQAEPHNTERYLIEAVQMMSGLPDISSIAEIAPFQVKLGRHLADRVGFAEEAEHQLTEGVETLRRERPIGDPDRFKAILSLSLHWVSVDRIADAESEFAEATTEVQKLPPKHRFRIDYYSALGRLAMQDKNYAVAESSLKQAIEEAEETHPSGHPAIAMAWHTLALMYSQSGAMIQAEDALHRAFESLWALPYGHPKISKIKNDLGTFYTMIGRPRAASVLIKSALNERRKSLRPNHPDIAETLNALGGTYDLLGENDDAENCFREALALLENPQHPLKALIKLNLESLRVERHRGGNEADLLAAIKTTEKLYPAGHPLADHARKTWFSYQYSKGKVPESLKVAEEFLQSNLELLNNNAGWQSERQQLGLLNSLRGDLDNYLSAARGVGVPAADVYGKVLAWKGAVTMRQERQRALRTLADPSNPSRAALARQIQVEIRDTVRQLESMYFSPAQPNKNHVEMLTRRCEELDKELGQLHEGYTSLKEQPATTPMELKTALAGDSTNVALVDFLVYQFLVPATGRNPSRKEDRMCAFVLRPGRDVAWIDLGPAIQLQASVDEWRWWTSGSDLPTTSGAELRRLVWEPIQKYVSDAKILLISPDGALTRVPFAALPGSRPGTFLIHEHMFVAVPTPAALPRLLARCNDRQPVDDGLLLVGDINYGTSNSSGTKASHIPKLKNAAAEIRAVGRQFRTMRPGNPTTELTDTAATRSKYIELAPQYRWQLLTTHGFFAPRMNVSADRTEGDGRMMRSPGEEPTLVLPGLSSGLWFAGANEQKGEAALTAATVSELDLSRVELVVLSACGTGLGEQIDGEGAFGLQRAYLLAGARSVIASWWEVDDRATSELVAQFFNALWQGETDKPMSRLAALHSAQLWMIDNYQLTNEQYAKVSDLRGGALGSGKPIARSASPLGASRRTTLPPYYWAGFVLSGDWR